MIKKTFRCTHFECILISHVNVKDQSIFCILPSENGNRCFPYGKQNKDVYLSILFIILKLAYKCKQSRTKRFVSCKSQVESKKKRDREEKTKHEFNHFPTFMRCLFIIIAHKIKKGGLPHSSVHLYLLLLGKSY